MTKLLRCDGGAGGDKLLAAVQAQMFPTIETQYYIILWYAADRSPSLSDKTKIHLCKREPKKVSRADKIIRVDIIRSKGYW